MLETLKKNSFKRVGLGIAILYIAAVVCIFFGGLDVVKLLQKKDIYDLDVSELKGKYVTADVYFIYDCYAYTTETSKSNPRPKTVSKQYVIPIGEQEYMGLFLNSKDLTKADALMKSSQNYLDGATDSIDETKIFTISGTILPMEDESLKYFNEYFGYDELDDETKALVLPYYLREGYLGKNNFLFTIFLAAAAVVCLICATVMLVRSLTGAYQKDIIAYCTATGNKDEELERMSAVYESGSFVSGLLVGDGWIMFQQGAHTRIWNLNNFVWAYKKTTEHRRNGIKTGTTYSLMICNTSRHRIELGMSEQEVNNALQYIGENVPNIVLGYNNKLNNMYQKDMARFQQIRTNPDIAAEVFN